jgi:phage-related tail fiber protein
MICQGEVAQDTLSTGAAVGGIALHAAEQRRHEMMRDWEKEHAVSEKNTPHGRKEAAKSALEHHYEAKEHALAAAHLEEDKGVRKMEETISSATGAVSGVVSAVKGKAQETVTAAANMSRLAAEAALEQKAAAQESYYKSRAVQESLTPHARKEAAKSALEAHIDVPAPLPPFACRLALHLP